MIGSAQLVEKLLRGDKIAGAETFGEPVVERGELASSLAAASLPRSQGAQAEPDAQLPGQGALVARHHGGLVEAVRRREGAFGAELEQDVALDAQELGHIPLLSVGASARALDRVSDGITGLVDLPQPG